MWNDATATYATWLLLIGCKPWHNRQASVYDSRLVQNCWSCAGFQKVKSRLVWWWISSYCIYAVDLTLSRLKVHDVWLKQTCKEYTFIHSFLYEVSDDRGTFIQVCWWIPERGPVHRFAAIPWPHLYLCWPPLCSSLCHRCALQSLSAGKRKNFDL